MTQKDKPGLPGLEGILYVGKGQIPLTLRYGSYFPAGTLRYHAGLPLKSVFTFTPDELRQFAEKCFDQGIAGKLTFGMFWEELVGESK